MWFALLYYFVPIDVTLVLTPYLLHKSYIFPLSIHYNDACILLQYYNPDDLPAACVDMLDDIRKFTPRIPGLVANLHRAQELQYEILTARSRMREASEKLRLKRQQANVNINVSVSVSVNNSSSTAASTAVPSNNRTVVNNIK